MRRGPGVGAAINQRRQRRVADLRRRRDRADVDAVRLRRALTVRPARRSGEAGIGDCPFGGPRLRRMARSPNLPSSESASGCASPAGDGAAAGLAGAAAGLAGAARSCAGIDSSRSSQQCALAECRSRIDSATILRARMTASRIIASVVGIGDRISAPQAAYGRRPSTRRSGHETDRPEWARSLAETRPSS